MLDTEVIRLLGDSPEQIERSALERIVLDLYRRREISVSRAAKLLGLDQLAFIRWSGALGVPLFEMTVDDCAQELRGISDE
jgi:predicted HTH domain antitoxin